MRAGMGVLALSPAEFWRATPRELAAALGLARRAAAVPSRADYELLVRLFPDER